MRRFSPNKPFPTLTEGPAAPSIQTLGAPVGLGLGVQDLTQFADCYPQACAFGRCVPNLSADPDYACVASKAIPMALSAIVPGLPQDEVKSALSGVPTDPNQLLGDVNNLATGLAAVSDVAGFFALIDASPPWVQKLLTTLINRLILPQIKKLISPVLPDISDDDLREKLVLITSPDELKALPGALTQALADIQGAVSSGNASALQSYLAGPPSRVGVGALTDLPPGTQGLIKTLVQYAMVKINKVVVDQIYNQLQKVPIVKEVPRSELESVIKDAPTQINQLLSDLGTIAGQLGKVKKVSDVFTVARGLSPNSIVRKLIEGLLDFILSQVDTLQSRVPALSGLSTPQIIEAVENNIGSLPEVIQKLGSMNIKSLKDLENAAKGIGVAGTVGLSGLSSGAQAIVNNLVTQIKTDAEIYGKIQDALKRFKNGDLITPVEIKRALPNIKDPNTLTKLASILPNLASAKDLFAEVPKNDFGNDAQGVNVFASFLALREALDRSVYDAQQARVQKYKNSMEARAAVQGVRLLRALQIKNAAGGDTKKPGAEKDLIVKAPEAGGGASTDNTPLIVGGLIVAAVIGFLAFGGKTKSS